MSPLTHSKSSLPILDSTNYSRWAVSMEMYLRSQSLFHYIESPQEQASDSDSAMFSVISLFINHVDNQNLSHIFTLKTPRACWETLKSIHQTVSLGHKLNIIRDFFTPGETFSSISAQVSHLQGLHNRLLSIYPCGNLPISEFAAISLLWSQHNTPFNSLVQVFLQNNADDIVDIADVAPLLLNEEHRIRSSSSDGQAFQARSKPSAKPSRFCSHCKRSGHLVESCFKLHPDLRPSHNKSDISLYCSPLKFNLPSSTSQRSWIVDSGCTSHISTKTNLFTPTSSEHTVIQTANGNMISPSRGRISFPGLTLHNVLLCPDAQDNLLSVSKLCDAGLTVTFSRSGWQATDNHAAIILSGPRIKNTYLFKITEHCSVAQPSAVPQSVKSWHRKLGHLSLSGLQHLCRQNTALGIPKEVLSLKTLECEACMAGKLNTTPFPKKSSHRASRIGQIIHSDVVGPMQTLSRSGSRYFVTFIDDYSRYVTVFPMKHKSDVFQCFLEFANRVQNHTGRPITTLRTDNGTEYRNTQFSSFCKTSGMTQQFTIPYNPSQNGVSERLNRTLLDIIRTVLIDSELPKSFWVEALLYATTVRNHSLTTNVEKLKTPYETWTGKLPDFSSLYAFGSHVYAQVPPALKSKLDPKSRKYRFLGHSTHQKGYRLLDPVSNQIINSRSVQFLSTESPINLDPHPAPTITVIETVTAPYEPSRIFPVNNGPPQVKVEVPDDLVTEAPVVVNDETFNIPPNAIIQPAIDEDEGDVFADAESNILEALDVPEFKPNYKHVSASNILPSPVVGRLTRSKHQANVAKPSLDPLTISEARTREDFGKKRFKMNLKVFVRAIHSTL